LENLHERIALAIADHPSRLNVRSGSVSDVIRRLVEEGVAATSTGELVAPGGRELGEFVGFYLRPKAPHLFEDRQVPDAAPAKPNLSAWTAEARLDFTNGVEPHPTRRFRPTKDQGHD